MTSFISKEWLDYDLVHALCVASLNAQTVAT